MTPPLPPDRQWEDTIVDRLFGAIDRLLSGSLTEAEGFVQQVAVKGPGRARRTEVALTTQLRVFRRDSFICRYCGQRTLFLPTLRLLSTIYPEHLPVDPGWKLDHTHPVYWTLIASADHVTPAIRGGGSDEDNLVTSCWRCNDIKRAWSLHELRWQLIEPVHDSWDGLSGAYPALCESLRDLEGIRFSTKAYHRRWLQAFPRIEESGQLSDTGDS